MIELEDNRTIHRFDHAAMNTVFSLRIPHPDRDRSLQVAGACFRRLDGLEDRFSRYRDDSDVSRINALRKGESLFIEEDTHACLKLAMEASAATGGLFDVTLGARIEHRKLMKEGEAPKLSGRIEVAPDQPRVACMEPGREIDLGGIGKGFALDRMAEVLREHGIESALISCAGSTLLARGKETWDVLLRGEEVKQRLALAEEALSASGTGFQGAHVLHPDAAGYDFPYIFRRVWVVAVSAAVADAFSTACLLMDRDELAAFHSVTPEAKRCFAEPHSGSELICLKKSA